MPKYLEEKYNIPLPHGATEEEAKRIKAAVEAKKAGKQNAGR